MEEEGSEEVISKIQMREDLPAAFDPAAYLRGFYTKSTSEIAINVILTFLPNVVSRIPKGGKLLDIGSGPTVHMAMYFRRTVDEVYLSDFLEQNLNAINLWLSDSDINKFDWSNVSKYIALMEGGEGDWRLVENQGRQIIKGVLHCDVLKKGVLQDNDTKFDIVTTNFCMEYAVTNSADYQIAMRNVIDLLKPGGYFVMGGIFEGLWYKFGGKHYSCHSLTETEMMNTLKVNKIDVDDEKTFRLFRHEDIFMIVGRKIL